VPAAGTAPPSSSDYEERILRISVSASIPRPAQFVKLVHFRQMKRVNFVVRVLLKRLTTKSRPKADNYTVLPVSVVISQDKSVIRQVSSSVQDNSVNRQVSCDDFKIETVLLYVLYNPVHRAYGSNVYVINTTNDLTDVSFVSSYPTMLQTYKSKIVYVQHTTRALELKRLVYEMLHMFQVHLERPLFNCRLELIISVIEQCTKDMCNSLF
jgi:hypothetical protein